MKLKKKFQSATLSFLERKYPGVRDIVNLLENVRERVAKQYVPGVTEVDSRRGLLRQASSTFEKPSTDTSDGSQNSGVFKADDGKWRPVVVTLGLMYKLQKVTDDNWYDVDTVFMQDEEKKTKVVELLAKYWWFSMGVGKSIRGKKEQLYQNIAKGLKKRPEDVLYAFTQDAENVEDHSPDIALVVDHSSKELVLTVCGTKMFPVPSVADVLMDLYADSVPFHQGVAHKGMALACTNILKMVLDSLVEKLTELKGYKLVILGYSLGAGVAQLLAIELTDGESRARLPADTQVLCVTYGAPPVYRHPSPDYSLPNIISVYNHNDGLASLSLHTVTKLFLQIRAVNRLGLGRRRILRLLRTRLGMSSTSGVRRHVMGDQEREREWADILTAVTAVDKTGFLPLHHIAGVTYLVKRYGEGHTIRVLQGAMAAPLAREVRLRGGMFNDHMPWGYASVFKDCGGKTDFNTYSIDMLTYI